MERLTQRIADVPNVAFLSKEIDQKLTACEIINLLTDRLAAYEDTGYTPEELKDIILAYESCKELYGKLALGDSVWCCDIGSPVEYVVTEIYHSLDDNVFYYARMANDKNNAFRKLGFSSNDFGKRVFSTKADADIYIEKKMKLLQKNVATMFAK